MSDEKTENDVDFGDIMIRIGTIAIRPNDITLLEKYNQQVTIVHYGSFDHVNVFVPIEIVVEKVNNAKKGIYNDENNAA